MFDGAKKGSARLGLVRSLGWGGALHSMVSGALIGCGVLLVALFRRRKVPLFGGRDLPGGITLRDKSRWTRFRERRGKKGPWE